MAKFFKKPSGNLRTPFYCFSAMAVGCLMGGSLSADENDKDKDGLFSNYNKEVQEKTQKIQKIKAKPQDDLNEEERWKR